MTELESVRERLLLIKIQVGSDKFSGDFVRITPADFNWLCDQLVGFLNGETVKRLGGRSKLVGC